MVEYRTFFGMPMKSMSTYFVEISRKCSCREGNTLQENFNGMARKSITEPFVDIPRKRRWLNI